MSEKILGYEDIQIVKTFELSPGRKILLYEDTTAPIYRFGMLFENPYTGRGDYSVERGGAFVYKSMDEAISEFVARIEHYLRRTIGSLAEGV